MRAHSRELPYFILGFLGYLIAVCAPIEVANASDRVEADLVFKGGLVIDGTGAPGRISNVAIRGDRIVAVGDFEVEPGAKILDAAGLVVAPGFIDLHSHSDETLGKPATKNNLNYLRQGVTTVVTGNCGGGPNQASSYFHMLERQGIGTNVIHLIPHGAIRGQVIGTADSAATKSESARMRSLVEREMNAGAWGLSSGLIYVPSRYADTAELIDLASVVARHGGFYASHIRNEGPHLFEAIDEAIEIGRAAGIHVHISHLKSSGRAQWGNAALACERIERARSRGQFVTADQYPYAASSTSLAAMVVPAWALQGDAAAFEQLANDPGRGRALRQAILRELASHDDGAAIRLSRFGPKPDWVGQSLVEIARGAQASPLDVVLDIQRQGGAHAIYFGMDEQDVSGIMAKPYVATASDGSAHAPGGGDRPHPRAYGTFPRKIRYALDENVLSLEAAIRSCTGLPASILGLPERGTLRRGAYADLIAFDPKLFRDAATFDDPTRYATGIVHLLTNGVHVIDNARFTNRLAGRVLRLGTDGPADMILKVGRIWTGNAASPWAQALAARAGVLVAVGSNEEAEQFLGPATRVIDRPGDFATPGLIDAHGHITGLGSKVTELDLRESKSASDVARLVRERANSMLPGAWVLGRGWDQSLWPGMEFPTAAVLDDAAPDRPVWLRRIDGHAAWANSTAMRLAGLSKQTQAPATGQIGRDAEGNLTGLFIDGAMSLIEAKLPAPSRDEIAARVMAAQYECLRAGLTGVHDAGIGRVEDDVFRELDKQGKLKLRVYAMARPGDDPVAFVEKPPLPRLPERRYESRAIKLFMDGAMGSRGAVLFDPYDDAPQSTGLVQTDPSLLRKTVEAALRNGWQVCTHAIGDKANSMVLDAYEQSLRAVPAARDARLRIEHAQLVRQEDVARFQAIGVVASMQPSHAATDMRWADARLGRDSQRVLGAYAWRWFLNAQAPLAFGSDFPVEIPSPFWGLYAAITRQDEQGEPEGGWHPEQRMTLEEALRGFTAGSAFAQFAEGRLGVIKEGMRADITVMDRDLFKSSPPQVLNARVTHTIIDGEVVFDAALPGGAR